MEIATGFDGLQKHPTFEQLINFIQDDPSKIKYPDRALLWAQDNPFLTQLDDDWQAETLSLIHNSRCLRLERFNYRDALVNSQKQDTTDIDTQSLLAQTQPATPSPTTLFSSAASDVYPRQPEPPQTIPSPHTAPGTPEGRKCPLCLKLQPSTKQAAWFGDAI